MGNYAPAFCCGGDFQIQDGGQIGSELKFTGNGCEKDWQVILMKWF